MVTYTSKLRGTARVINTFTAHLRGALHVLRTYLARLRGRGRVEDTNIEGYELYSKEDSAFTQAELDALGRADALETFASLPHTTTAALTADKTTYLLTRKRNRHNVVTQNIVQTAIAVDADGDQEATPPSDADKVMASAYAGATVRVRAWYGYLADGDNAADTWLIYLGTGSDPDPAIDPPADTEAMVKVDGTAKLDWTSDALDDGADARVIVRTRREGSPDVDSVSTTVHQVTADDDGPAAPAGGIFIGASREQHQ